MSPKQASSTLSRVKNLGSLLLNSKARNANGVDSTRRTPLSQMIFLMSGSFVLLTLNIMGNIFCLKKKNLMLHSTVKNAYLFQLVLAMQLLKRMIIGGEFVLL